MKRFGFVTVTLFGLMLIPLIAVAQDVTPPAADETGLGLSAAFLVAAAIKMVVDWIRQAIPAIDGMVVNLLATALAYGATYIEQVGTFTDWVSRINTALVLAGTSALVAEGYKYLRARRAPIVIDG